MPRNVAWRRTYSDVTCASQMFAVNATIYILRQTGPTGFLLKEENEPKNFKVFLGDPHSCTCPAFRKEKDLCKHICWVLLKKFRLSQDDPLSWQLGLSDLELDEVMRGPAVARRAQQRQRQQASVSRQVADASEGRPLVAQREIADDDVCPICQDEFMNKKLPVTYCKFGCGNNVHIKCMKVWAEHQLKTSQNNIIKCPMCREDFGPITLLKQEMHNANAVSSSGAQSAPSNPNRMDRHVGIGCSNCRMAPIEGKCYRCCTCADFYLCQACFNTPAHTHHLFQFRHKRNQRWRNAQRMLGAALPDAVINDLMNRELSASDYETLLHLDNTPSSSASAAAAPLSDLTEETVQMLPVERVREGGALLAPGAQCRVCLRGFHAGQYVRKLPCQHKFHKDCIDGWLLHSRPTCPIDSTAVFTARPPSDTADRQANRQDRAPESDMLVPGSRLLQEAMERRSQLNQHLTQLMVEINPRPAAGSPSEGRGGQGQQADLPSPGTHGNSSRSAPSHFPFDPTARSHGSGGSPSSFSERSHQRRLPASLRTKVPFRQRSGSHGRVPPPPAVQPQDLYLGNDPRLHPPPVGEVMAAQLGGGRGGIQRPALASRKPLRGRGRGGNHSSIMLEGNRALDNLTLRDLL